MPSPSDLCCYLVCSIPAEARRVLRCHVDYDICDPLNDYSTTDAHIKPKFLSRITKSLQRPPKGMVTNEIWHASGSGISCKWLYAKKVMV
ncbi:hypothetical protein AVEN_202248-1 [Araneus ventricosus]|uniref:Uncharacterized protein n=1 Tax=Araneus ventricosus TaxID=182803 RepID=A0A4Y2CQM4_ARAVE|nr:hypothetical protein AVEN_202248-1 [Araneus ventricosus]